MTDISHLFIHAISLQRSTPVADGKGGQAHAYAEVEALLGRINPATQRDIQFAGQNRAEATHAAYLPSGTDVRIDDRLVFDSRLFRVTVANTTPSEPIYKKALALEIQEA